MSDLLQLDHGPCWVCGAEATDRCDHGYELYDESKVCNRWCCDEHVAIGAQHWDLAGWDGVDIRCMEHRAVSFAVRDLVRGQYLPLPCAEPISGER